MRQNTDNQNYMYSEEDSKVTESSDTTVETELKVTQSALDVHMGCTPFVKD